MDIVQSFYDSLATQYDKLFFDWHAIAKEQALILDRLFQDNGFDKRSVILDCACGIGTQAIGRAVLGYPVIAAVAPKTTREQEGQLYEGHDYALLGQAADYLFVMTYEWGYTYGPPLPVAPLPNVRAVLEFAISEAPPGKTLMGIPNYGYDFSLPYVAGASRATSIGNRRAVDIARQHGAEIQFDQTAMAPYFTYTDMSGTLHEVWFENARSIYAKFSLLKALGLKGVGYWNLMREFPQLWLLQNALFL